MNFYKEELSSDIFDSNKKSLEEIKINLDNYYENNKNLSN